MTEFWAQAGKQGIALVALVIVVIKFWQYINEQRKESKERETLAQERIEKLTDKFMESLEAQRGLHRELVDRLSEKMERGSEQMVRSFEKVNEKLDRLPRN